MTVPKWPEGQESLFVKLSTRKGRDIDAARRQIIVRAAHGTTRIMNKSEYTRLAIDLLLDAQQRGGRLLTGRTRNRPSEAEILEVREFEVDEEELRESA